MGIFLCFVPCYSVERYNFQTKNDVGYYPSILSVLKKKLIFICPLFSSEAKSISPIFTQNVPPGWLNVPPVIVIVPRLQKANVIRLHVVYQKYTTWNHGPLNYSPYRNIIYQRRRPKTWENG